MISFTARRWINLAILLCLSCLSVLLYTLSPLSYTDFVFYSGWVLFGLILALALYNARKKLPFLPFFTSSQWLQFHIYTGLLSAVLFLLHTDVRVPNGTLEIVLTVLYLAVIGSGFVGLALSRLIPKRLTTRGDDALFERIPALRRRLREELEHVVSRAVAEAGSVTIAEFYAKRLVEFFEGPRHFGRHLVESSRPRYRLLNELAALDRYLNSAERMIVAEIADLICIKDDLDYSYAHQTMLKYWLFVHIPLTYSLLMVGLVHGVLMWGYYEVFQGGPG